MNKQLMGIIFMTAATIFYGSSYPLLKKAGFNPVTTMFIQVFFLLLTLLPFFIVTKPYPQILANRSGLLILFSLGVLNAGAYYLVIKSFDFLPQWQISMFSLFTPFITAIVAFYVLGEPLSGKLFFGMIFVSIGMWVAFR